MASLSGIMWASLAFQSLIVAFGIFLSWFWMLRRYLASRLTIFSFLTPLFGVSFGVLLLDDPVGLPFVFGALQVCPPLNLPSETSACSGRRGLSSSFGRRLSGRVALSPILPMATATSNAKWAGRPNTERAFFLSKLAMPCACQPGRLACSAR